MLIMYYIIFYIVEKLQEILLKISMIKCIVG